MRLLGKLVIGLIVAVALLAVAGFALPRDIEVSRSIVIDAPPEKVFPYVNNLKRHAEWSPWAKIDPETKWSYQGPDRGVGQKVMWSSDHREVGTGSQTIVESVENRRVATELDFGDMGTAKAWFRLQPEDSGTRISWDFATDAGNNPVMRWMGLMFDRWIGEAYDKGLTSLKQAVEQA